MASAPALAPTAVQIEDRIHRIFDHLYANAHVRTPRGIAFEVGKVIHTAMFIEAEKSAPAFDFNRSELRRLEGGDTDLVTLVAKDCRTRFRSMNRSWRLYSPSEDLHLNDFDLAFVCAKLSGLLVGDKNRDVFGDALEIFRYEWAKRNGGQFFTDQRVTHLAMSMLQFNPLAGDDLVDLCAGTGGFLLAGLNSIRSIASTEVLDEARLIDLASRTLLGQEADREVAEVCNATLSARLGDKRTSLVSIGNSLEPGAFLADGPQSIKYDTHACAATNPPFGTKITIKDPNILRHFELAYANHTSELLLSNRFSPKAPDILFIEQNLRILKPGKGRLAIVVPYQIASGPQTQFVREWILKNAIIRAVIDLPAETFQPHTGTKACLLVVERRVEPIKEVVLDRDGAIFMASPQWIGHDRRGNPVYKRNPDGTLSSEVLSDFEKVAEAFQAFIDKKDPSVVYSKCFRLDPARIGSDPSLRFNAQFHAPHAGDCTLPTSSGKSPQKSGWKNVVLKDVVKSIFYPGRFKRNYVPPSSSAVPFLGGTNISQLLLKTEKWVEAHIAAAQGLIVEEGWILVTRSGSTGIISSVPKVWAGFAISEHVIRIVPDPSKLSPEYLLAFLRTRYAQAELSKGVYGSVIDEISTEYIGGLIVPVAPRRLAKRIAESVHRGEIARNEASEKLLSSVEQLEAAITG